MALAIITLSAPLWGNPWAGAEDPTSPPLDPPDRQELIRLLVARDQAIGQLLYRFSWIDDATPGADPVRWRATGWVASDRGRLALLRWQVRARGATSWEWTTWDGGQNLSVTGVDPTVPTDGWPSGDWLPDPWGLAAPDVVFLDRSPLAGALSASVVGATTGLYFRWETWSQRLSVTEDMVILGIEEIDGQPAVVVLFDASNAPGARSDGIFQQPHCVWIDLETLLAVRLQTYMDGHKMREAGMALEVNEETYRPPLLEDNWIPVRYVQIQRHRRLEGGVHIGVRALFGVASKGSPFEPTRIEIDDPHLPDESALQRYFQPPHRYPLTVADRIRDRRFVLGEAGGAPCTLQDLAFWGMLLVHGPRLSMQGSRPLKPLFDKAPHSSTAILTFLAEISGEYADAPTPRGPDPIGPTVARPMASFEAMEQAVTDLRWGASRVQPDPRREAMAGTAWIVQDPAPAGSRVSPTFVLALFESEDVVHAMVPGVRSESLTSATFFLRWPGEGLRLTPPSK